VCTIGYHRKLNLVFKNRDKNVPTAEVVVVKPDVLATKTEGAKQFGLGINSRGCAFVGSAVNTPAWTSLAAAGKIEEAASQFRKENEGLVSPTVIASEAMPEVVSVDGWLEVVLNSGQRYMGYNLLLADEEKAVHVELYDTESHVTWLDESAVVTNHFQHLTHGPQEVEDYPDSYKRLEAGTEASRTFVSEEDVFGALKPRGESTTHPFWRVGNFYTVSSSVVDLDTKAIHYAPSSTGDYGRISWNQPPRGSEKAFIEMSRYIDLPTYHKIERAHPFYEEMISEINSQVEEFRNDGGAGNGNLSALELGAGTGLCSLELVRHSFLDLDCLEIDEECCEILGSHPEATRYNVICGDARTFCKPRYYDLVVSTFAHDHIHYDMRFAFAKNIYDNLKNGGRYLVGGEMLPHFGSDLERKKALFRYHNFIISMALDADRVQLSELENNALKSGLDMVGDFKRHERMFEEEMLSAGFTMLEKKKMGPVERDDVGGVFVYVFGR
jgi:hypothetical protein